MFTVPADLGFDGEKYDSFRTFQAQTIEHLNQSESKLSIVAAPTGCHAYGQGILLADGSVKSVQDIQVGDKLLGPDSQPRTVTELKRGYAPLYTIVPVKGEPFIVNGDHILSLVRTSEGASPRKSQLGGTIVNVSVSEWLTWSTTRKHLHKLYRSSAINFLNAASLPIDAYFMGVLLGDGSLKYQVGVTTQAGEIEEETVSQATKWGVDIRAALKPNAVVTWWFGRRGKLNPLRDALIEVGIYPSGSANKAIPLIYKQASVADRYEILAGLLDTDGHLARGGYDYISKSKTLAHDVAFLARSLGLAAYIKECQKSAYVGHIDTYWRVSINGNTNSIPCRVSYKQAQPRLQKKSVLRTGLSIYPHGHGFFYGFTLTGDGLYLMDDFTVTHNSGKSMVALSLARLRARDNKKTRILTSRKVLQEQYINDYTFKVAPQLKEGRGRNNFLCELPEYATVTADRAPCVEEAFQCGLKHPTDANDPYTVPCAYFRQRAVAEANPISILNYQFYFRDKQGFAADLLLCDEAHSIDKEMVACNTVEINHRDMDDIAKLGYKFEDKRNGILLVENPHLVATAKAAFLGVSTKWNTHRNPADARLIILIDKLIRISNLENKVTVVEDRLDYQGKHVIVFSPVLSEDFAYPLIFSRSNRVILMSATIFSPSYWAHRLGIDPAKAEYMEVPSTFPPVNRPVYLDTVVRMGAATKGDPETERKLIAKIDSIITTHMGKKGLIHSVSNPLTDLIMNRSSFAGSGILIRGGGKTNNEALEKFKKASVGVFVSPSATEGLDLPDDLCEFTIFPKVPYLGQDAVTKVKMDYIPGYYDYQAMAAIVQGAGRGMRHKDDRNEVYILDSMWHTLYKKTKAGLPRWFTDSLIYVR